MPLEDAIEEAEGGSRDNAAILVCDDDPAVLEFVCEALEATGYRVLPASNGQMAISLLRNNKTIRLLLADYTMPEMNGAVVARKVQAAHPSLPILLMTGNADIEAIQAELPEINLLRKPFDRHVLAERVSSML
jgi:CheY-like chemotaxis protein